MAIWFHSEYPGFHLHPKRKLKEWLSSVIINKGYIPDVINYSFINDEKLLDINLKYLKHNFYTDIISFDYSDGKNISGDIYISIDRVKENALDFKVPFDLELKRVLIHGVLHFLGYKDKLKSEKKIMRKAESECLNIFNSTN